MRVAKQPERTPVTDLQEMLRLIDPSVKLSYDGIYDDTTSQAVKKLQKDQNLPQTGEVDGETWKAIRKAYKDQQIYLGQAHPLLLVLQPNQVIQKGSDNLHLYMMQAVLTALAQFYADVPTFAVTGILDEPTAQAVIWFQEKAGLPQNGEIDKKTWAALAHEYRQVVGDGTGQFPIRMTQNPEDDQGRI
jgi:murein L,D-transpeptidase YcbB/YkuD